MRAAIATALIWSAGASLAHAQDETTKLRQTPQASSGWTISGVLENDLFNDGEDRDYTNGVLFSVTAPELPIPTPLAQFPLIRNYSNVVGDFSISQAMYTPRNLSLDPPDPNDRPYAGVLLANFSAIGVGEHRLSYLTLSLGVIGPDALAEQAQKRVHRALGAPAPQGWDHQIGGDFVGGLRFQHTRIRPLLPDGDWSLNLEPEWSVSLGNLRTEANLGAIVKLGYRAPRDLGAPRLQPATPGSGYFESDHVFGGYVFAGLHQHYVGYDATFDRPPTDNGPGVDKYQWTTDAELGAVVALFRWLRVSYTHEFLTKEFRGQDHGHGFGAVSLSINLPH